MGPDASSSSVLGFYTSKESWLNTGLWFWAIPTCRDLLGSLLSWAAIHGSVPMFGDGSLGR